MFYIIGHVPDTTPLPVHTDHIMICRAEIHTASVCVVGGWREEGCVCVCGWGGRGGGGGEGYFVMLSVVLVVFFICLLPTLLRKL